jgi:hypothetical protein
MPFIPSYAFIRKHTCYWSTKVDKDKELDVNKERGPKVIGGCWKYDRSDTRVGWSIGETLRYILRLR